MNKIAGQYPENPTLWSSTPAESESSREIKDRQSFSQPRTITQGRLTGQAHADTRELPYAAGMAQDRDSCRNGYSLVSIWEKKEHQASINQSQNNFRWAMPNNYFHLYPEMR